MLVEEIALAAPPVPANYHKGARLTWHQRRRHRAVLTMLRCLDGRVLDYGCGYGDLTWAIARTHPVHGVDVDAGRVAHAAREFAPVPFSVCDPQGLEFPKASFDVVTSVVVVHFTPDPRAYLREARRVLRPGGHLILACKNVPVVRNVLRGLAGRGPARSDLWVVPRPEVHQLLQEEGFRLEADTHFYDPPFQGWTTPAKTGVGLLELGCSLAGVRRTCSYYVMRLRRD